MWQFVRDCRFPSYLRPYCARGFGIKPSAQLDKPPEPEVVLWPPAQPGPASPAIPELALRS